MPNVNPVLIVILCCVLVALASFLGGWLPLLIRLTHTRIQIAISFVAGLMLGVALLHFLPDANEELHSLDRTMAWVLAGFLVMFFLQRFFHYHSHEVPGDEVLASHPAEDGGEVHSHLHQDTEHVHGAGHHHDHDHHAESGQHKLSWVAATAGLTLHSLLAGIALGAAISLGAHGAGKWIGLGTALAVILHKPFDAMAISTLMAAADTPRSARYWVITLFALVTPLGIVSFYLGMNHWTESSPLLLGSALAFSAGTFLCIACSDLLPELHFHAHDRFWLSLALLAGLAVAVAILWSEHATAGHDHGSHESQRPQIVMCG